MANRILIVEDDIDYREPMAVALLGVGFVVVTATDGAEALERMRNDAAGVDAIVLDLVLPEVSGWEFFRLAREDVRFAIIPVIATTSVGGTRVIPDGVVLLRKPYTTAQLVRELHAALRRKKPPPKR